MRRAWKLFLVVISFVASLVFLDKEHLLQKVRGRTARSRFNARVAETRPPVDVVVGIPTIPRPGRASYLEQTVDSALQRRAGFDAVIFVIYIANLDKEWSQEVTEMILKKYSSEVGSGLIHILYPRDDLYPDWEKKMKLTLGDPRHQVRWRSKQNIDQAYLMDYVYSLRPKYYLGLEDDVLSDNNYLRTILEHIRSVQRKDIVYFSYCRDGAIGKVFSLEMLPTVAKYIQTFWNYKPLDWLFYDLLQLIACRYPKTNCEHEARSVVVDYPRNLFQHLGKISSLVKLTPGGQENA